MSAQHRSLSLTGALGVAIVLASLAPGAGAADGGDVQGGAQVAGPAAQPGSWQPHSYRFHFMGFTSTYSCDGLEGKLKLLLRLAGARSDAKVTAFCSRGYGVPDKLATAQVEFSTLQPAAPSGDAAGDAPGAARTPHGSWRQVQLGPRRPFQLEDGDCELVEQFRDTLLPMFITRAVNSQISCVPHQQSGAYSLSFEVFAPPAKGKGA